MKRPAPVCAIVLLLGLATASESRGQEVLPGIHVLRGIGASLPQDDLEPLGEVVGDAEVVASGTW